MDSIGDDAVADTNDDAAICKYQATQKGYYQDPYIEHFLSAKVRQSMPKKAPEINRGYFARSVSIAYIVEKFIARHPGAQIISLGAGYDTLFWRLRQADPSNELADVKYVEIDMSLVVVHKLMAIKRHKELSELLGQITYKGEGLHSQQYHLISFDLRQVDKSPLSRKLFQDCLLDPNKPTLCIAECVLVYMPVHDSASLIQWLSEAFKNLTVVNYEQCNISDRFGDIMLSNMNARHCDLMGAEACKSLVSQEERLKSAGLSRTKAWTLLTIYKNCLLPSLVERISQLEFLDERELLEQLLEHYCIVIGSNQEVDWIPETEYWLSKTSTTSTT